MKYSQVYIEFMVEGDFPVGFPTGAAPMRPSEEIVTMVAARRAADSIRQSGRARLHDALCLYQCTNKTARLSLAKAIAANEDAMKALNEAREIHETEDRISELRREMQRLVERLARQHRDRIY